MASWICTSSTLCILLFSFGGASSECYESAAGDFCSTIADLKSRQSSVKVVEISANEFTVVDASYFTQLSQLTRLKITEGLFRIKDGAFANLKSIQKIELANNSLYEIRSGQFENLPVTELILINNSISYIRKGAFSTLDKLIILDLSSNVFATVYYGVFNGMTVQDLILARNRISYIQEKAFDGMLELKILNLAGNQLTKFISSDLVNPRLYKLETLDISSNKITNFNIGDFAKLKIFKAARNSITELPAGTFGNNVALIFVDISYNALKVLNPNVLPRNGLAVNHFDITFNRLSFIDLEFLARLPRMSHMSICGNPWQCPCFDFIIKWFAEHNSIRYICHQEFENGVLPICMYKSQTQKECDYYTNLYQDYKNYVNSSMVSYLYGSTYPLTLLQSSL